MPDLTSDPRRGAARYRSLAQATDADVWLAGLDGGLRVDLPRWREATRQTEQELRGSGWVQGVVPEDRERVAAQWSQAVREAAPCEIELRVRPVRGPAGPDDERVLQLRGVPVRDEDGTPVEYVGLVLDATAHRRSEALREDLEAQASVAADRTVRLQRLTARLSSSLRVSDIADAVLEEARSVLGASGGGLALLDETATRLRYPVLEGYDPDVKAQWTDISVRTLSPGPEVLRTGRPLLLSGPQRLLERYPTPEIERFVEASQERAWARLPLSTTGKPFGVLSLGFLEERDWTTDDQGFLQVLADLSAQAVERALSYERERDTALLLQRSLLPDRLPDTAGLRLSGTYQPGSTGMEVGGDWYDAFAVPGGRVALVLGDVRGKGAPAASVMGQVRSALRAYAALDPDPALVLSRLDLLLQAAADPEEIATVAYLVLDPATGRLEHASAGHLPALLAQPDGAAVELEGGRGLPLGVQADARETAVVTVPPGGVLLLVSDGLVEQRRRSLSAGLAGLRDALGDALRADEVPDVDGVAAHLLAALLDGPPEDDVTLLVVERVGAAAPAERRASVALPPELTSAREARRFVRGVLDAWELERCEEALSLAVSELVTNAVVHARSGAVLTLAQRAGTLRLDVVDGAEEAAPRRRAADDDATNGRGLALVAAVATRWGTQADGDGGKSVWVELDL